MKEEVFKIGDSEIVMREVLPEDKDLIANGIKNLSQETVQHRFFLAKKGFSAKELASLTEYDKRKHFAIGAANYPERDLGVAVGRFNIDEDDPSKAEFALLIIDQFQGLGLGKILLEKLITEAKARGIKCLFGQLKSTNNRMLGLARKFARAKTTTLGGGIILLEIFLDD